MDKEWLESWQQGQRAKMYEAMVDAYGPLVRSVCRRYLRDPADVDDAVQETFVKLASQMSSIHTSLQSWLAATAYTSSHLLIRRELRERRRRKAVAHEPDARQQLLLHATIDRTLARAMGTIDAKARTLLQDRFFKHQPLRTLADVRNESIPTMSRRVSAALAQLAAALRELGLESIDEKSLRDYLAHSDASSVFIDEPLRFADDWRVPVTSSLNGGLTTLVQFAERWARPIRVGVIVSHLTSVSPIQGLRLQAGGHIWTSKRKR